MATPEVHVESLERRAMLSAVLSGGVASIDGTDGNDIVLVQIGQQGVEVRVNGVVEAVWAMRWIERFEIDTGGGRDFVHVKGTDYTTSPWTIGVDVPALIETGAGNDVVIGGGGDDTIVGGSGHDRLLGEFGNDAIGGGAGADRLIGGPGNDALGGGGGNDILSGGSGDDALAGGRGIDKVDYSGGYPESLYRTEGKWIAFRVTLDGRKNDGYRYFPQFEGSGVNLNPLREENDNALADNEVIIGGDNEDTMSGNDGANTLFGGGGHDSLRGLDGNDWLDGGAGTDTLQGGFATDTLVGGGAPQDPLNAGGFPDLADYSDRDVPLVITLDGVANDGAEGENDFIAADVGGAIGGDGSDHITGNDAANRLAGHTPVLPLLSEPDTSSTAGDTILGLGGNDAIIPMRGDDFIDAGAGDDLISHHWYGMVSTATEPAFHGFDTLLGGEGNDRIYATVDEDLKSGATLDGGAGDDLLVRGALLIGGEGNDKLVYGATMEGGDGDDRLYGRPALSEVMYGGAGKDFLTDYTDYGNPNNFSLVPSPDKRPSDDEDYMHGGGGFDKAIADSDDRTVAVEYVSL